MKSQNEIDKEEEEGPKEEKEEEVSPASTKPATAVTTTVEIER